MFVYLLVESWAAKLCKWTSWKHQYGPMNWPQGSIFDAMMRRGPRSPITTKLLKHHMLEGTALGLNHSSASCSKSMPIPGISLHLFEAFKLPQISVNHILEKKPFQRGIGTSLSDGCHAEGRRRRPRVAAGHPESWRRANTAPGGYGRR